MSGLSHERVVDAIARLLKRNHHPGAMLQLRQVTKRFGPVTAVADVSLEIHTGEFFSLLGPSGCGKTSLLRTIAGIYSLDAGSVHLDGVDISNRPMNARNIALVFQNYALFPHLSVFENIAFGLRMRKLPADKIRTRVAEAIELVRMQGMERRKPGELSGGQQQRVALARAVVVEPRLLLLDEPLSNLDAKLREEMRDEIRALQRRLGLTTVLVTHDLREAFAVSDRIAVMREGRIEQVGSAAELYDHPSIRFVAGFVGHANILAGAVQDVSGDRVTIRTDHGLTLTAARGDATWERGRAAWATLRSERLKLNGAAADTANRFEAIVEDVTYLGNAVGLRLAVGGTTLRAHVTNVGQALPRPHEKIIVSYDVADLIARPEATSSAGN
jgi:ABC-type Fe3+/spermidine/putrescine transport system ATPase subunit